MTLKTTLGLSAATIFIFSALWTNSDSDAANNAASDQETCAGYASYLNNHFIYHDVTTTITTDFSDVTGKCTITMDNSAHPAPLVAFNSNSYFEANSDQVISEEEYVSHLEAELSREGLKNIGNNLPEIQRRSMAANSIAMRNGTLSPANFPWSYSNVGMF